MYKKIIKVPERIRDLKLRYDHAFKFLPLSTKDENTYDNKVWCVYCKDVLLNFYTASKFNLLQKRVYYSNFKSEALDMNPIRIGIFVDENVIECDNIIKVLKDAERLIHKELEGEETHSEVCHCNYLGFDMAVINLNKIWLSSMPLFSLAASIIRTVYRINNNATSLEEISYDIIKDVDSISASRFFKKRQEKIFPILIGLLKSPKDYEMYSNEEIINSYLEPEEIGAEEIAENSGIISALISICSNSK